MKSYKILTVLLLLTFFAGRMSAQYDDMYYDPDRDRTYNQDSYVFNQPADDSYAYDDYYDDYDNEEYAYYDDYDYYYTSRIRRFHRPFYGFGFFDPVYVDMAYYDPFFGAGPTVLIYDDVFGFNNWWRFNRFNRWNRFNRFGWGPGVNISVNFGWGGWNAWNPWGWNSWNRFNRWGWNSWNRFGWGNNLFANNFYGIGGGGFYCPPTWGNNYVYNTVNNFRNETYYGPRTTGTTRVPRANEREIRREGVKDVTNTAPRTTTAGRDINRGDRVEATNGGRTLSGRQGAQATERERIRIFDDNERTKATTVTDERTRKRSNDYWGRRDGRSERSKTMQEPNNRNIDRNRTNTRTRNRSIFGNPRNDRSRSGRTYDRNRGNSSSRGRINTNRNRSRSSGGSINRGSSRRSSGSTMGRSRGSSSRSSMGRSRGSSSRSSMGRSRGSGSSRSKSSGGSRSKRGGNNL